MTQCVRWGIVGAGRIAEQFAADIRLVPGARLVAIASRYLASAQAFATRHGGIKACGDYQSLFDDEQVDAVYIATPHTLHAAQARAALTRRKAVLCEKPLTVSPGECQDLQAFAGQMQAYLTEGMWTWYLPAIRQAQDWISDGRIGRVLQVKADFGYPLPFDASSREYDSALAGGCLLDMGIYPVAIAALFMPDDPVRLEVVHHLAPNGVEDDVAVLYDYGDGRSAALGTSFRCKLQNWAYVIGDGGYIAIPDFWRASSCRLFQRDAEIDRFDDDRIGSGFEFQIDAVSADIRQGCLDSPTVRAADSLRFQQQLARIKAAFRT